MSTLKRVVNLECAFFRSRFLQKKISNRRKSSNIDVEKGNFPKNEIFNFQEKCGAENIPVVAKRPVIFRLNILRKKNESLSV